MKSVSGYLQGTVQSVQTLLGNSKETSGPEGAVASKTIRSVNMINQGLARLQTRGGGVLDISLGGDVQRGPSYPDPV